MQSGWLVLAGLLFDISFDLAQFLGKALDHRQVQVNVLLHHRVVEGLADLFTGTDVFQVNAIDGQIAKSVLSLSYLMTLL